MKSNETGGLDNQWVRTPRIVSGPLVCPECFSDEFRTARGGGYICEYIKGSGKDKKYMYMCEQIKSNGQQCWFTAEAGNNPLSDSEVAVLFERRYLDS